MGSVVRIASKATWILRSSISESALSINEIDRERVGVSNSLQAKAGIFRDIDYPRCGQRPLQCLNE